MLAYHSDPLLKQNFVALIKMHEDADDIIQGTYWQNGRGCAVGCSIASLRLISGRDDLNHNDHAVYEEMIGVPRILARLEDGIFEGLPIEQAKTWPARFAAAIRPGADLSMVWPRFAVWLLVDAEHGVIKFAKNDKQRTAIQKVADLYAQTAEGVTVDQKDWKAAAAYAAADAAYAAAAAAAAADAADAAYAAAAYAADAAAYAAAYAAARQQARIIQSKKLLELLAAA